MNVKTRENLAQKVLDMAKNAGATDSAVKIGRSESITVNAFNGKNEGVSLDTSMSVSLDVYIGNKKAHSSGTDISDKGLNLMVENAITSAKSSMDDPYTGLPDISQQNTDWQTERDAMDLVDKHGLPSIDAVINAAVEMDIAARNEKGITNTERTYASFTKSSTTFAMTTGFIASYDSTGGSMGLEALIGSGVDMSTDGKYESFHHWEDFPTPASIGVAAANKVIKRQNKGKLEKGGKIPVVFSPQMASKLLRGNLAACLSGASVADKFSFIGEKLGEKIFGNNLTVIDDRAKVRGMGSRVFDGSGIAGPQQLELITDGKINTWMLGLHASRKLEMTANGRAGGSNFYIASGDISPDNLLKDVNNGFYLTDVMGHGFTPINGDFAYNASGFVIRGGFLCEYVEGIGISANLGDMLNNLTIANDFNEKYNTSTILVEGITVSV